jgi:hypothetical protein
MNTYTKNGQAASAEHTPQPNAFKSDAEEIG